MPGAQRQASFVNSRRPVVLLTSSTLAAISRAIAVAAGLPVDAVSLYENSNGSFTVTVFGVGHTGTLEAVLEWAAQELAQEARATADREFEADPAPVDHAMRP